jgi:hypothetical protein
MTLLKNLFTFLSLTVCIFGSLNVHGEVLISEKNLTNQDAIIFAIKKGEEITKEITLKNISNEDVNVVLDIENLTQLDGGAVTTQKTGEGSKGLAKYAQLNVKNLAIPSLKSVDVPIKITIPSEFISGEYGLGFTLSLAPQSDEKSSIKNIISRGLKIYVFVGDDEKTLGVEIDNIAVNNNKSIEFNAKNTGSLFAKISGTYSLSTKNGEFKQGAFQRDIISSESKRFLVSLPKEFNGEGELNIEYSIEPLTKNGDIIVVKSNINKVKLPFNQNSTTNTTGKQNIFQSIWGQIVGGILFLGLLGFVLRKEIRLLLNLRKNR